MMTSFPPQAGMPQHPGMPHGQPMPGGVPHPQSMGGPMQMHPGVSAPHMQQVSQAPMIGMQPGMSVPGGPNAHAMSHLAPSAGQMMHQPGMPQQAMNPHVMNLNQQQRMMWQRQQLAARQMGMQQPGQQAFNPQQLAAMQASGQMANLPPHLQQQMANAQMLHQQQAAMQEAARQQQHQNNLAVQHQIAMQHSSSHGSHGGHPAVAQPGQGNQPPMRPQSAMSMTTNMEARPSPAATAGPQGGPQPVPQSSQPPNQPNQQPQTSGPQGAQGQTAPSQPQQNPGGPNNVQQPGQGQVQNQGQNRPAGPQAMNNQQMAAQALMRQQQAAASAAAAQARGGATLLQAFNFANKLGAYRADQQMNDLNYWQAFVQAHFTDDAIYRMNLRFANNGDTKTFEVHASGLPRFLFTQYETDIDQVQLVLDGNQEKKLSETHSVVRADRSRLLHWFRDGTQLVWNGLFQVIYNGDKIEQLNFETKDHQTYLPLSKLQELCPQASPNQNRSPKMTKTQQKRNQQPPPNAFDLRLLPTSQITDLGIHKRLQTHLELGETMNLMQPLISFSRDHPEQSVAQALRSLVEGYAANPPTMPNQPIQGAFPPGGVQGGVRPNIAGAMQSPALSNSGLPGQPNGATPSPHQSNMAPPMAPGLSQQSHQSSNTSPNVSGNKRRRSTAAGVKGEEDVNGTPGANKVKQSPRMASGAKRVKGS